MASPLTGADGNVEFLLHATVPASGAPAVPPVADAAGRAERLVAAAVAEAAASTR
jgi:hypothetical protein